MGRSYASIPTSLTPPPTCARAGGPRRGKPSVDLVGFGGSVRQGRPTRGSGENLLLTASLALVGGCVPALADSEVEGVHVLRMIFLTGSVSSPNCVRRCARPCASDDFYSLA